MSAPTAPSRSTRSLYCSRPLSPPARLLVSLAATAVTFLFYLYALLCVLVVLALSLLLVVAFLVLLRFGLTGLVTEAIRAQLQLTLALLPSIRLARTRPSGCGWSPETRRTSARGP